MADADIQITAGSGTKVDTRTVGAGVDEHRQVICIGDPSTAANVALVDATFGLEVDVSRVVPGVGATNLGKAEDSAHADGDTGVLMLGVRNHFTGSTTDGDYSAISVSSNGDMHTIARRDAVLIDVGVTGVTTATTAYTAGDQVGAQITLASAARVTGGYGMITGVVMIDQSDIVGAYDVVFFDSSVTPASDNAAFAISDADSLKIVGIVQLAGAFDIGNNRIAQAYNLAVPYKCAGSTSLYAALITRGSHTFFTAGALPQLRVYVERY